MATLKEIIAERKRRTAMKDGGIRATVMDLMPGMLEEILEGLRPDLFDKLVPLVEKAVLANADRLKVKGDKGEPGAVDEGAIIQKVITKVPRIKGDKGEPGKSINEEQIIKRIVKKIPKPEKGEPGKDAVVDHEKLAQHVAERIMINGELRPEHITGLQELLENWSKKVRAGAKPGLMRGGGDIVLAGTGITITRDTTGRSTIAATSGGGFTALNATEIPDGTIQTFTFAGATAQPTYIVADNVWLKAVSKAGRTNWTWNAGLKEATFFGNYAPTDDIFGVV